MPVFFLNKILYAGRPYLERNYLSNSPILPKINVGEASSKPLQKDDPCPRHFSLFCNHVNHNRQ